MGRFTLITSARDASRSLVHTLIFGQNDSGSRYTAQQAKAARLCRTARLLRRRRTATLPDPGYFRGRSTPDGFYRNRNDSGNADAFAVSVSQSPPRLQSRVALRKRDRRPVLNTRRLTVHG